MNFFSQLTSEPSKAARWYAQDANLSWSNYNKSGPHFTDTVTLLGKHSIYQFFKTIPEYIYEILSYDTQTVISGTAPDVTVLVVSGNAYPVETDPSEPYNFQSSFFIQMAEIEKRAVISYHTMNVFREHI